MASPRHFAPAPTPPTRILLAGSLAAGLAYPFVDGAAGLVVATAVKGAAVGLLAIAAALLPLPRRGWLALILGAGAVGDVLLNLPGLFIAGAAAFALGHVTAIQFYLRNRRRPTRVALFIGAAALLLWGLVMPVLVSPPGTQLGGLILYAVLLCGMAGALALSRFPRLALVGALLFIVSDTLLIMRMGGRLVGGALLHGLLVWWAYYAGQALIFLGVASGLARDATR